ncbi:MAG: MBOAT family protein [Firmicutes bacterium]|nr:MBOAT family protein [Bacillota bacterium]
MSLASLNFIYYFIPVFFAVYYLAPKKARTAVLLCGSLLFYAWGSVEALCVLIGISVLTWVFAKLSEKNGAWTWAGIVLDIAALCWCKYLRPEGVYAGMSFYVFHAVSFLCDCRKRGRAAGPLEFAVYMTLFPKLMMGPIMTFDDFDVQYGRLSEASADGAGAVSVDRTADGAFLFALGFGKKALFAGPLSEAVSIIWPAAGSSVITAWAALGCFGLQLYYDFSGYSDMARGLGLMAGFELPLNFDHPYCSASVSEFWRRWHMSLGAWFKKYIYFPLGGSRKGLGRTLINLMIVWLVTGIWHGDTLNFVLWGAGLGIVICFEKITGFADKVPRAFGTVWQIFWILMGWVLFSTESLADAAGFYASLFSGRLTYVSASLASCFHDYWGVILMAVIGAGPAVRDAFGEAFRNKDSLMYGIARALAVVVIMVLATVVTVNSGFSAFIYTRF